MNDNLGPHWSYKRLSRAFIFAAGGFAIQIVGYFVLFNVGPSAAAPKAAIVPALLLAYNFGMYAGFIVAILTYVLNIILLFNTVPDPASVYLSPFLIFGTTGIVVLAGITGRVREVGKSLRTEIAQRKTAQQKLSAQTEDLAQRLQELNSLYALSNRVGAKNFSPLRLDYVLGVSIGY